MYRMFSKECTWWPNVRVFGFQLCRRAAPHPLIGDDGVPPSRGGVQAEHLAFRSLNTGLRNVFDKVLPPELMMDRLIPGISVGLLANASRLDKKSLNRIFSCVRRFAPIRRGRLGVTGPHRSAMRPPSDCREPLSHWESRFLASAAL